MDISSARLAALLKEAMTPQAVPSAKADPVKAALVKALVAPPAPSGAVRRACAPSRDTDFADVVAGNSRKSAADSFD